jgi:predicted metalloprotease with PDZ domain
MRVTPHTGIAGEWSFDDAYFAKLVESIARTQASMLDVTPPESYLVSLAPFPMPLTGLRSAAMARDRTVIMMLNQSRDPVKTRGHFERHVAHEMFHFYMPNSFRIRDNFDWFWEGFSRYIGLLTLLEMKSLTFDEFLDLLLAEYDAYRVNPARNEVSLLAASPEKFQSAANYEIVYRKGMVVAALYDLELRWQSRGRKRLSNVVGSLYREYAMKNREIGNREVLDELKKAADLSQQIADDVEGTKEIDLISRLEKFGIGLDRRVDRGGAKLVVNEGLSGRQKELISQFR